MSFLAPLFFFGALAIAAPIVFHLIRRTTREVTPFSSLMFLQPTPPRMTRRSRLENLWLLLLRCLVLLLLALGFARPFFRSPSSANQAAGLSKRSVILLDTSASMRREDLWEQARKKAETLLGKATPVDEVAVLAFDRGVRTLASFEDWKAIDLAGRAVAAGQRLATLTPGWAATQLDSALMQAAELLDQPTEDRAIEREVVVISDLQEGSRLDALQGYEWPRGLTVTLDRVEAKHLQNASIHWVSEADERETSTPEAPLRLRVVNGAETKQEQFQLRWSNPSLPAEGKLDAYVPAGQSRIIRAPKPPSGAAPSLVLSGDEAPFDNTVFLLPLQPQQITLIFAGKDADDDPHASLYYLRRAFPKTARQNIEVITHGTEQAVPAFQLQPAQLLILGEGASEAVLASARQFAREGRIVVAPLTSAAGAQAVGRLLEKPQLAATEALVKDYALLAQIDFQHPIFAPFADPRFSDFTKIHFWKYRKLDPAPIGGAQVVARFDSGDPAIVQAPLGKGSVVILTSSWQPADSQLALSSKFLPLLHALLEQSSNAPAQQAQYFVGDEVALPQAEQPFTVRKPDLSEVAVAPGAKFAATDLPGIYHVTPGTLRFVVNLAPEESRIAPVTTERFSTLGVPLRKTTLESPARQAQRAASAHAAELESRQKLWRWVILGALAVLLLETLIAERISRVARASVPAQT